MANIYDALEPIFHEPSRLSICSALSELREGLSFSDIKKKCGLTDSNLSRHLIILEESGTISITKSFANRKPKTTATLSDHGRRSFLKYLATLDAVVKHAQKRVGRSSQRSAS